LPTSATSCLISLKFVILDAFSLPVSIWSSMTYAAPPRLISPQASRRTIPEYTTAKFC